MTIQGTTFNMGYEPIFDPPGRSHVKASIDASTLSVQWVALTIIAAVLFALVRENRGDSSSPVQPEASVIDVDRSSSKSGVKKEVGRHPVLFGLMRVARGAVGVLLAFQVIGVVPALTWVLDPSLVTPDMLIKLIGKFWVLAASTVLFFGLREIINALHKRWYGVSHPALARLMSL